MLKRETAKPPLTAAYEIAFPRSRMLFDRASNVLAGGAAHDSWAMPPFPVAMNSAHGPYKTDLEGRRLVDYWMGHGSLLFGHGFEPVIRALHQQLDRGTHYAAAHELQVSWAELITRLVPSAEKVRFTASGTEAVMLAFRVARASTGKSCIVRFDGHFHGWHDEAIGHFVDGAKGGINRDCLGRVLLADPFSIESVTELLESHDVAAVILEPGGGSSGALPWSTDFLQDLRRVTIDHGSLLIFDEVISGFRYSPGGVQELTGVRPDMTILAKILAGGLPGGALVGSAEVMNVFGHAHDSESHGRVVHTGSFNGNPLSAAAGIAMLAHLTDGRAQHRANTTAQELAGRINRTALDTKVDVSAFAQFSTLHVVIGSTSQGSDGAASVTAIQALNARPSAYIKLRQALLIEGVDMHPTHGWVSAVHDSESTEITATAFRLAFERLRAEGEL